MGKPTALSLARQTLRDAVVVDLKRVNDWTPDTFALTVAEGTTATLSPGRYVILSVAEMELTLTRLAAVDAAMQLVTVARKQKAAGTRPTRRTR